MGLLPAERKRLAKREKDLLKKHQREWLGPLAPFLLDNEGDTGATYRLARGWIASLTVPYLTAELRDVIARSPQLKVLTELHIESQIYERDCVGQLAKSPYLGAVRVLKLGQDAEEESEGFRFPAGGLFTSAKIPDLVATLAG